MKKYVSLAILAALVLMLVGVGMVHAEVIAPRGEGQIGLQAVVLCEELTIREQRSASSEAVKKLHYGDLVIVQPQTGGWAACFLSDSVDGGPAGWVNEDYLAIDPAWYRTEEKTPVYAWDDEIAPKVALLDANTTLPILKDEGDWLIVSLRGATGWIHRQGSAAWSAAFAESAGSGRQDGERYEGTVTLEGMEETVRYEHVVNDEIGIEIDYDYESFVRQSDSICERFVSCYDDPDDPENYLEVSRGGGDVDAVLASISRSLSDDYDIITEPYALDGAGSCVRIDASCVKGKNETPDLMQTVYVIPTADGCVVGTAHYTFESAEGFGARMHEIMDTLVVTGGR